MFMIPPELMKVPVLAMEPRFGIFSHIMPGAIVGEKCSIGQNVNIGSKAVVGNGVKVQNNVSIYDSVIIEDDVFLRSKLCFYQ